MTIHERMLMRIASACWVSEASYTAWVVNGLIKNKRRSIYWRARSIVMMDRSLRAFDGQPVRTEQ